MEETSDKDIETTKFVVKDTEDLNTRVNRSSFCKIEFSPIDVEMNPTKTTRPFISNVEGLLNRIENSLSNLEKNERKKEILDYIQDVKEGEEELVIVMKDLTGKSYIGDDYE